MKKDWELTEEAFNKFLAWLHPDRDQAAEKYEAIRYRLIIMFRCRGCAEAEELADEAINRVIKRAQEMANTYKGNPIPYFITVANHLYVEHVTNRPTHSVLAVDLPDLANPDSEDEQDYECLERCMQRLPPKDRNLILQYYQEDKQAKIDHRRKLAKEMGIGINALRIRAHRIRVVLQQCMDECLKLGHADEMD